MKVAVLINSFEVFLGWRESEDFRRSYGGGVTIMESPKCYEISSQSVISKTTQYSYFTHTGEFLRLEFSMATF